MPATLRPRWFRFSLRAMFLVMTALIVVVGWNFSIVHQRQALLPRLPWLNSSTLPWHAYYLDEFRTASEEVSSDGQYVLYPPRRREPVSWIRRLFGDREHYFLGYLPGPSVERVRELFPEAQIVVPTEKTYESEAARHGWGEWKPRKGSPWND